MPSDISQYYIEHEGDKRETLPLTTKFTKQKKRINQYATLYSFEKPM